MKKLVFGLLAALLAFAAPAPGGAVVATTKYALTSTAWTDLGVGPVLLSCNGVCVYAIGDVTPAIPLSEGFKVPTGASVTVNTLSHVWAMAQGGAGVSAYVSPIVAGGGSGGAGTLTAGTSATSGFAAGQLLMSDGSLLQPSFIYDTTALSSQRNATTAQSHRVYNTYTDASNGEWAGIDWQTTPNVLTIGTQANGTGTARAMKFVAANAYFLDYAVTFPAWIEVGASANGILPLGTGQWLGFSSNPWLLVYSQAYISAGTQPTITGAGGTCATTTKVGGATAGTVVLSAICASTNTIAFTGMPAVTNGYSCDAEDRTTRTAGPFIESATTTTGFTLTVGATSSVAADVLQWKCLGY